MNLNWFLPPSFVFPHIYWHNMTWQNTNWRPVKRSTLWLLDRSINNTRSKLGIDRRRCRSLSFYQTKYIIYSPAKIWITTSLHFSERWRLEVSSAIIVNTPHQQQYLVNHSLLYYYLKVTRRQPSGHNCFFLFYRSITVIIIMNQLSGGSVVDAWFYPLLHCSGSPIPNNANVLLERYNTRLRCFLRYARTYLGATPERGAYLGL